jgi:hypothetical protein
MFNTHASAKDEILRGIKCEIISSNKERANSDRSPSSHIA